MFVNDAPSVQAFSKDLSNLGIGVISETPFPEKSFAILAIHSIGGHPVYVKSEVRWSDTFGKGWYLTGWKFHSLAAVPPQALKKSWRGDTA